MVQFRFALFDTIALIEKNYIFIMIFPRDQSPFQSFGVQVQLNCIIWLDKKGRQSPKVIEGTDNTNLGYTFIETSPFAINFG
mmetsp:Transcript_41507/g.88436  ORF Transcript_41507/g.88436 Transcript_41507/m.88436 type:complete len:82 (-) Transcript_41507:456-701(-)